MFNAPTPDSWHLLTDEIQTQRSTRLHHDSSECTCALSTSCVVLKRLCASLRKGEKNIAAAKNTDGGGLKLDDMKSRKVGCN